MRAHLSLWLVIVGASATLAAQRQPVAGGSDSVTVHPQSDVALLEACSRALSTQDGSPRAIQACRDAVAAADRAGAAAFAPRAARSFLGDVYMFAKQWSEAAAAWQSALRVPEPPGGDGLETGETVAKIGFAQMNLGDLAKADASMASAAAELRSALSAAEPERRQKLVSTLRSTLLVHARVKQLQGDTAAAQALEQSASELAAPK